MQAQMISHKTSYAVVGGILALGISVALFGIKALAIAVLVVFALATPMLALWRRNATGVAGPEPSETPS
ncbi:MAG: putative membrane protein YqgA involved in biofilm formation [Planctomycetota bacterium]|jgi:uncharacterized membrane protein YqgA involved in biofilm formation